MTRTSTVKHSIACRVCGHGFTYIGSLDSENTLESDTVVIADSVVATEEKDFHTTDENSIIIRNIPVELIVTCPECKSKQKQTHAVKVMK